VTSVEGDHSAGGKETTEASSASKKPGVVIRRAAHQGGRKAPRWTAATK